MARTHRTNTTHSVHPARSPANRATVARFAPLACALGFALAAPAAAQQAEVPLVVSTGWLAEHRADPRVVLLEVVTNDSARPRIPGTRPVSYMAFTMRREPLATELPPADSLLALFGALGVSDDSHVVVYAEHAPMATRALLTLAAIGVTRASYLDGGLARWRAEGRPVTTEVARWAPGRLGVREAPPVVVDADYVLARSAPAGDAARRAPGTAFLDTRTDGEYRGTGNRSGMPSAGHVPGAVQLEWEELFADGVVTLRPREELARLYAERVGDRREVITYCWIGYRASATWFVARYLGYDAKLYDGSYQDWQLRKLPVVAGEKP